MSWTLIHSDEFRAGVTSLGGYSAIDIALETVCDGLRRNPFGFEKVDLGLYSFRYAKTVRIGGITPLIVIYTIEKDRVVILQHIEVA